MADQQLLVKLVTKGVTEDDLDEVGRALSDTGIHYELDAGRLILMSPMKNWHADVSRRMYWIVDRHPGGRRDAVVEFFKLGHGDRYHRTGEALLSELEEKHGTK
jgi:hypothetical protein